MPAKHPRLRERLQRRPLSAMMHVFGSHFGVFRTGADEALNPIERSDIASTDLTSTLDEVRRAGCGLVLALVPPDRPDRFACLAREHNLPYLNVSLALARHLLDVPIARRAFMAAELLPSLVDSSVSAIALGRLGLLHAPELQLNVPLALKQLARSACVLAEWRGAVEANRLTYARPGHAEYGSWPLPAAAIVAIT